MTRDNPPISTALVRELLLSVEREEAILERLLSAAKQGAADTVMHTAHELMALRAADTPRNCAA